MLGEGPEFNRSAKWCEVLGTCSTPALIHDSDSVNYFPVEQIPERGIRLQMRLKDTNSIKDPAT